MEQENYQEALKLFNLGENLQAEKILLRCLDQKESSFEVFGLLGYVYGNQGKYFDAIFYLNKALGKQPKNPEIIYNLALAQYCLGMYQDGVKSFELLIPHARDNYELCLKLAEGYEKIGELDKSIKFYNQALKFNIRKGSLTYKIINLLISKKKYLEAIDLYASIESSTDIPSTIVGEKIYLEMMICNWDHYEKNIEELNSDNWIKKFTPNHLLSLPTGPDKQKLLTEYFVNQYWPSETAVIEKRNNKKIRIGYFSSDFHNHATAYLLAEFFELHNKELFEIFAISYGSDVSDFYRERLKKSFNHFYQVNELNEDDLVKFSRDLMLDVAVDLKGHGKNCALPIFSKRVAPIQINWLVYPGTVGGDFMDYIIADEMTIPDGDEIYYSEKVLRMKSSYQVSDRQRLVSQAPLSKESYGLPKNSFVFACFNNNYKITPEVFDIWMRVLNRVPNSILWLLEDNTEARKNLIKEASKRGVAKEQIKFAPRLATPEHLARHVHIDLFVDTFYYSAHTTANDALWMGVPIVTLYGDTFASRVCASLLHDLNLDDLIAYSVLEYENKIINLALNPSLLKNIKAELINRAEKKLFDTPSKVKDFEEIIANLLQKDIVNPIPFDR